MKRFIVLTAVAAAVTLFTGVAVHAYEGGKGPARKGNPLRAMLQKLDLNDVQKQQVKRIFLGSMRHRSSRWSNRW